MTTYKRKKITTKQITSKALVKREASVEGRKELALRKLQILSSAITRRSQLAGIGQSYFPSDGGAVKRDLYDVLGYKKDLTFQDYNNRYKRGDIAKRIIDAYPNATWRKKPIVSEMKEKPTAFDEEWQTFVKEKKVWHYLSRVDRISGIGEYGLLYMGFDDGGELSKPVERASELLYMSPCNQGNAPIKTWIVDPKDPRYGLPETYSLNVRNFSGENASTARIVHHSRVIHVAEDLNDNDVYGTPRLEGIMNRLQDLDLICGGSAEMFWRGAFPGYAIIADEDADLTAQDMDDLEEEIQDYMHDLQRYIRLAGAKIEGLDMQVADPSKHFDVQIKIIGGAKGIPIRILLGSERGELASSQDERGFNENVDVRRVDYAEPTILRPFIGKQIEVGILPMPEDGYTVEWPDLSVPSAKDQAEVSRLKTEALAKYAMSPGADQIIPSSIFLKKFLDFADEDISQIDEVLKGIEGEISGEMVDIETVQEMIEEALEKKGMVMEEEE